MTIADAVRKVLRDAGRPMSTDEIYEQIIEQQLYKFGAKNPKSVMSQAIRERSDANPKAKILIFRALGNGRYALIDKP